VNFWHECAGGQLLSELWLYCGVVQRAYYATRAVIQNGFVAKNLSGGFRSYNLIAASWNGL